MVHRIQNRNPGYSDTSNIGNSQSFSFSNSNNSIITDGANALQIQEEVKTEKLQNIETNQLEEVVQSNTYSETLQENKAINENDKIFEEKQVENNNALNSNGLENFNFDEEETPELFNSDFNENKDDTFSSAENENKEEEDDLEIPAFLRRQKN